MRIFPLFLALFSTAALAVPSPSNFDDAVTIQAITAADASANHTTTTASDSSVLGKPMTLNDQLALSFQCAWTGVTGSINATTALEGSNDGTIWTAKASATFTLAGASGNANYSITDATARYYRLVYTAGTVSAGVINCYVTAK